MGEFRAHDKHCMVVQFTPDDAHLLSGGFGGQARIWTPEGELVGELSGHESSVNVIRISGMARWPSRLHRTRPCGSGTSPRASRWPSLAGTRSRCWRSTWMSLVIEPGAAGTTAGCRLGACPAVNWSIRSTWEDRSRRSRCGSPMAPWRRPRWGPASPYAAPTGLKLTRLAADAKVTTASAWSADGSFVIASAPGGATLWETDDWEPVRSLTSGGGGMLPRGPEPRR